MMRRKKLKQKLHLISCNLFLSCVVLQPCNAMCDLAYFLRRKCRFKTTTSSSQASGMKGQNDKRNEKCTLESQTCIYCFLFFKWEQNLFFVLFHAGMTQVFHVDYFYSRYAYQKEWKTGKFVQIKCTTVCLLSLLMKRERERGIVFSFKRTIPSQGFVQSFSRIRLFFILKCE